jgi:hypothetical protein
VSTNPYFTQYHTQRFSFIGSPQQRDGTSLKDQRFLNMYPELIKSPISDGKKYYLKKRPGLSLSSTQANVSSGTVRGMFYWVSNNTYYYTINNQLYAGSSAIITCNTDTTPVGFCEYEGPQGDLLFFCDGHSGWTISTTNTVTPITDANFPTPHIATPIFLDGYIFLAKYPSQTIFNSNLQDPLTWPSDGFIDAEMFPDNVVWLSKCQNYLACIGSQSIEWLYDNANATGSPLQRNAPAVTQFGCPAPSTISQTEKELILVGETGNGGRTVWIIDGFQPTEIGNEPVREALDEEGTGILGASAYTIQAAGHKWYVLNLVTNQRTFVYDFEEQMWHEWSSGTGQNVFMMRWGIDGNNGHPMMMGYGGSNLYEFDPDVWTDNSSPINCQVRTTKIDFDTITRKRYYRLSLAADSPNGTANTPMTIQWSDDDYNTWSTSRTLNINGSYPTITQLGISRRRAFLFTFQQPYPLRMESFEVDIIQEVRR